MLTHEIKHPLPTLPLKGEGLMLSHSQGWIPSPFRGRVREGV